MIYSKVRQEAYYSDGVKTGQCDVRLDDDGTMVIDFIHERKHVMFKGGRLADRYYLLSHGRDTAEFYLSPNGKVLIGSFVEMWNGAPVEGLWRITLS